MKAASLCIIVSAFASLLPAETPPRGLRDLNGYFPFTPVSSADAWQIRRADVERRVLIASGLWPMPDKTPLNPVVHGRVERDDYVIDRVIFESLPGHFVSGSLYRPKEAKGKIPAILCPHGHWPDGRFMDRGAGSAAVKKEIETGAEELESAARSPLQARCVQLARMGCAAFLYDMLGYADSLQFPEHRHGLTEDGFLSVAADSRLQTYFGLQTWNSVRALDFLLTLDGIDPERIGCTGASGGGTQTMMIAGFDQRIAAAFPCVMVSTSMQGGCTCENSHYLRINQGNIDIAALTAPRPLGLTAANDWTKELEDKGLPDLKKLFETLGKPDHLTAHIATQFPHNYNLPSRLAMYSFYNRHFRLGLTEPIAERDFTFATREETTVWTGGHSQPSGDQVGAAHERTVMAWMTAQDEKHVAPLVRAGDSAKLREVAGKAWETIIGRPLPGAGDVRFDKGIKEERGGATFMDGITRFLPAGEDVPCTFWHPANWNGTAVLWLSGHGAAAIAGEDGKPTPAARALLAEGVAVACPTLYLQGATEQPKAGDNTKAKPRDFREFSGYTYGYNPTLLARRVHDAMTVAAMMRHHPAMPARRIVLAGTDGAGAVAAAAGAMLHDAVQVVAIDADGFSFNSLQSHWHPDFVPGAVKYGGLEALLKLAAPAKVVRASGNEAVASGIIKTLQ